MLNGFSQGIDCSKFIIFSNTFDSITDEYSNYQARYIENGDTAVPNLQNLARCWLSSVTQFDDFNWYDIPPHLLAENPDLVFLIINSKSIAEEKEKQSWFDLYPLMNESQINRLRDILWREVKKLHEIEHKYQRKSKCLKDEDNFWDDKNFQYLGVSLENSHIGYWTKTGKTFIDEKLEIADSIILIIPTNMEELLFDFSIDKHTLRGWFDDYSEKILNILLCPSNIRLDSISNKQYIVEYWKYFIDKMLNDPSQINNLNKLASIKMEQYIIDPKEKRAVYSKRLWALFYTNMNKNQLEACNNFKEMMTHDLWTLKSPQLFLTIFPELILIRQNAVSEDCNKCIDEVENLMIDYFFKNNNDIFFQNIYRSATNVKLMISDYILKISKNEELKQIAIILKDSLISAIESNRVNYGKEYSKWYRWLNQQYLTNFDHEKSLFELTEEVEKNAHNLELFDEEDLECALIEYLTYYCLYQFDESADNKQHLIPILRKVEQIWDNPSSKAYKYLEKDIADVLLNQMMSNSCQDMPFITLHTTPPTETNNSKFLLELIVSDGGKVKYLEYSLNGKNKQINVNKKNVEFRHQEELTFQEGDNNLTIEFENFHGNKEKLIYNIKYVLPTDEFITRQRRAILFYVDDYSLVNGYDDLEHTKEETEQFATELEKYGFTTRIIRNPTREEILDVLFDETMLQSSNDYSQLIFYYSGHGDYHPRLGGYVIPSDATNTVNPTVTCVQYSNFINALTVHAYKHVLFICDACYSGSFLQDDLNKSLSLRDNVSKGKNDDLTDEGIKKRMQEKTRLFLGSVGIEKSPGKSILMENILELFRSNQSVITFEEITAKCNKKEQPISHGAFGGITHSCTFIFKKE